MSDPMEICTHKSKGIPSVVVIMIGESVDLFQNKTGPSSSDGPAMCAGTVKSILESIILGEGIIGVFQVRFLND